MKLKLHTISPVHIGSGNPLEPFEYFVDNNVYYRLDQNKAFKIVLETYPDFPEKYGLWIELTSEKLRKARKNNDLLSQIRKNFNFKYFCEEILGDSEIIEEVKKDGIAYKCELPYGLQNKKQVNELLKTADNRPYIPGTSIKGAIRTILMWRAFLASENNLKVNLLNKVINSEGFRRRNGRSLDDKLSEEFFICGIKTIENGAHKIKYNDIKLDIMKFIRISDARPVNAKMSVFPANLYLTDKLPQGQTPAVEAIDFNSVFEFEININEEEIRTIYELSLKQGTKRWISFDKKFKRLFGFYPNDIPNGELEEKIIDSIFTTISDFKNSIWNREIKWLANYSETVQERGKTRENADIDSIKEFYEVYEEIPVMFKLGWASGFTSTTIFDTLENNPETREFLKKIFKEFKIGIPQNRKKDPNVTPANLKKFPKSRRLTAESKLEPIDPFGWVALLEEGQILELE